MKRSGIIVGAGILGSAVAYELARRGVTDLQVLDTDLGSLPQDAHYSKCGVRHLWTHRVNMDLARCSMGLFSDHAEAVGFERRGFLWLFSQAQQAEGEALLARALQNNLEYSRLPVSEIRARYPFLDRTDDLAFALFGPRDGTVDTHSLKNFYRSHAQAKGVVFHDRVQVTDFEENAEGTFVTSSPLHKWEADFTVLCTGAGTLSLLQSKLPRPCVKNKDRETYLLETPGWDLSVYGTILDSSRTYFHGRDGEMVCGSAQGGEVFFETQQPPALRARSSAFEKVQKIGGWKISESETPDFTGILGRMPGYRNILEAHSFSGRGVVQSYGAAVAIADLVIEDRFIHLEADALTRERFDAPKQTWLFEALQT